MGSIAFAVDGIDIVNQGDLFKEHPRLPDELWSKIDDFREQIKLAFSRVLSDLQVKRGYPDPAKIADTVSNVAFCRRATIEAALSKIFLDFHSDIQDRFYTLHQFHEKEYNSILQAAKLDYDVDDSGTISDLETGIRTETELIR